MSCSPWILGFHVAPFDKTTCYLSILVRIPWNTANLTLFCSPCCPRTACCYKLDAGIAFLESMNAKIYNNKISGAKYGIRLSLGSAGNEIFENTFDGCSDYGLYTYEGSDEPLISGGRPYQNHFYDNIISDTPGGVKFKYSDNIKVTGKLFAVRKRAHRVDKEDYVG